jgi:hypothetical protein
MIPKGQTPTESNQKIVRRQVVEVELQIAL